MDAVFVYWAVTRFRPCQWSWSGHRTISRQRQPSCWLSLVDKKSLFRWPKFIKITILCQWHMQHIILWLLIFLKFASLVGRWIGLIQGGPGDDLSGKGFQFHEKGTTCPFNSPYGFKNQTGFHHTLRRVCLLIFTCQLSIGRLRVYHAEDVTFGKPLIARRKLGGGIINAVFLDLWRRGGFGRRPCFYPP